ncbi:gliding motility-associated C-terminal domain-containing protein [Algoriphagus sp. SE2]|uniref:DUF7507 domain-containing protein n=1 Tax=Algoriphagus sp. SE2 TaxID=3141536 RepID=UPI0031CD1D47
MVKNLQNSLFGAFLGLLISFQGFSQNLIHNFEFNNNLNDSKSTGVSLTPFNVASSSFGSNPNSWNWTQPSSPGGGLELLTDQLPDPNSYSIGFRISFAETGPGYKKILSFKGPTDDNGLYFQNNNLEFFPFGKNTAITYALNTFYDFVLTRNASGAIIVYVVESDGTVTEVYNTQDTQSAAVPRDVNGSREFRFFMNDQTATEHTSGGSVRNIRLWDAPLSAGEIAGALGSVTTGDPIVVTSGGATITGEVNPQGTSSTFSFEYGETPAYGQTAAATPSTGFGSSAISVQATLLGLKPETTYYYRLKSTNVSGDSFGSEKTFTTLKAPGGVGGAELWLDASDPDADENTANNPADDTDVTVWKDKSGNGNDVTTSGISQGGVNPPSYLNNQFNGNAALRFDKANSESLGKILSADYVGDFTLFIVLEGESTNPQDFDAFFSSWNAAGQANSFQIDYVAGTGNFQVRSNQASLAFGPINQELDLFAVRQTGTNLETYSDGVLQNQASLGAALGFNSYRIGVNRNGGSFYDSKIAEIIVYPRSLTPCEIEQVNDYLGSKYGRDYYDLASNFDHSASFPNDISGIGAFASACTGLRTINEAQSSILTVNNPSSNDTQDEFLTFGHDNGALVENTTNLPAGLDGSKRIGRNWIADRDGDVGVVDLNFNLDGILISATQASDFKLIIDPDGDGDFSTGTPTVLGSGIVSANNVKFIGVDLPDGAVFSIITDSPDAVGSGGIVNRVIVNPSFENGPGGVPLTHGTFAQLESQAATNPEIDGWFTNHPPAGGKESPIESWRTGFQGVASQEGNYFVELNAVQPSRLYQTVYLVNGESFEWSYHHKQRSGVGTQTVEYSIYSQDGTTKLETIDTNTASSTSTWDAPRGTYTFTGATGVYQIGFEATAPATGGAGNFLDNIRIGLNAIAEFNLSSTSVSKFDNSYRPYIILNGRVTTNSTITFQADPSSTAVEGVDYSFAQKTITIPPGDYSAVDSIPIPVEMLGSMTTNENRILELSVASVSGDVEFGDSNGDGFNSTLIISILDKIPGGVIGTNLWYKADEGVTTGTFTWANQGVLGTAANATTRSGANSPTFNNTSTSAQINFNPSISFNSSNTEALATPTIASSILGSEGGFDVGTQFVVFRQIGSTQVVFNYSDGTSAWAVGGNSAGALVQQNQTVNPVGTVSAGQVALVDLAASTASSGSTFDLQLNGGPSSTTSGASYVDQASGNALNFAFYNGGYSTVDIAEIVLYPSLLSAADRNKVQSYLAIKYGISLGDNTDAVAYTSSSGTEVWTADDTYKYDIFGIGKDDASDLNQTQSNSINTGSGDGTGQNGTGSIVLRNPSSLEDGDYLLVGHDNATLDPLTPGDQLPASLSGFTRIGRQWLVRETGDVGDVDLTFDINGLGYSGIVPSSYRLLIDTDQDGDFTTGQPTIIQADASSLGGNTTLIFNDLDLQDLYVFTIITSVPSPGAGNDILWLEANNGVSRNGSNQVTGWSDQTGINAFTVVGTPTYEENAINFNPIVGFDNSAAATNTAPPNRLEGNTALTAVESFAVYKDAANSNHGSIISSTTPGSTYPRGFLLGANNQFVTVSDGAVQNNYQFTQGGTFHIANTDVSPTNPASSFRINGASTAFNSGTGDFADVQITPLVGGAINASGSVYTHFSGELAEIILYPFSLSSAEKQEVESYLAIKYGITLDPSIGAYVIPSGGGTPTAVWDNTNYWNDVFGIGREDSEGLNQTASNSINTGSGDGTGQSGKGNIILASPSSLDDGDFLMIGHDNGGLSETSSDLPVGLDMFRLGREWKVQHTGDVGTLDLEFDFNGLTFSGGTTDLNNYRLLIDNDGDGDFTTGNVQIINPDSFGSPKLIFNGVNLVDGAVFTFATGLFNPSWTLTKSTTTPQYNAVGDILDYTLELENTGNVDIISVNIDDPNISSNIVLESGDVGFPSVLEPGETWIYTATYVVSQADIDAGSYSNTATATGTPVAGSLDDAVSNTVTATADINPAITLVKSITSAEAVFDRVGQVIDYRLELSNTGNVTLDMVNGTYVQDPKFPTLSQTPNPGSDVNNDGKLNPGETWVYTPSYTVVQVDIDRGSISNTARSQVAVPGQADLLENSNTVVINADQQKTWTLSKSSGSTSFSSAGEVIPYQLELENTGNLRIIGVTVSDPLIPNLTKTGGDVVNPGILNPGEIWIYTGSYTATQSDLDQGFITNTATANGNTIAVGSMPEVNSNSVTVPATQTPDWELTKSATESSYSTTTDFINYELVLANTGNVSISSVSLTDSKVNLSQTITGDTSNPGVLDVGESWTYSAVYGVSQADIDAGSITNTATASGTPAGGTLSDAVSNTIVINAVQSPSWKTNKASLETTYDQEGDVINYAFSLVNTGNVSISGINLSDPMLSIGPNLTASSDKGNDHVLSPNETWAFSGSYTVTQADIEAGSYTNTAMATGTPAGGTLTPATSNSVTVPAVQNPSWTLDKSARVTSFDRVGEPILYLFLVTNTGNVNITSVDVFDETLNRAPDLGGNSSTQDGILNPGETWTYAIINKTTQADLDRGFFTNTARINGNSAAGPPPSVRDSTTITAVQTPSFSFEKKALTPTYSSVNDPITYQLILTNTGNVTLSNSTISDPLLGLNQNIPQAIAPGDSVVVSGNYKVTQADLDRGEFINTATASTEGPNGVLPSATDTARVTARQSPTWSLSKTSDKSTYSKVGEVIAFTFTLTNTGNVSITGVSLTDNKVSPSPVLQSESLSPADNILSPGESFIYTATYTVTQADIDGGTIVNTATASGTVPSGAPSLSDVTDSDTLTAQSNPSVLLTKTADKSTFELPGEVITYTIRVENTGNVTLDQLEVQDNLTGFSSGTPFSLSPGGVNTYTTTYTVTQADLDAGEIVNTATVSGEDPSNTQVTSTDTHTVRAKIAAALDLEKTANPTVFVNAGEVVTYTFELTNTGNVTLSNIVLDDPRISFNQAVSDLAPGQAATITHNYTLTQSDINDQGFVNTATATATSPLGKSVTATDQAAVTAVDKGALDINKVALDQTYTQVGEAIDFEITVTNVGNVTIDNVVVTDNLTSLNVNVGTLNPGQSSSVIPTSYIIQQADLDAGQVVNIASVTGVESTPQATPVNAQDRALSVAKVRDALIFTKVAQTADFDALGDVLSYQLIVENAGNVTLNNVVVSDPLATVVNPNIGTVSPGQVVTLDATYSVQQADVDRGFFENIAAVTGTDPLGTDVSELARATIQGNQNPSISLSKTGSPASYSNVGETITYTLEVRNSGNVTLTDVQIVDPLTNTNQTVSASLAPNQTVSISETYTVTQQDIDRGSIVNTATATALDPAGQTQQTQDSFTATATQTPQLSFTKAADKTEYDSLGEVINYELNVSNAGNVTLKNVIVTDPLTGLNSNIGELAPSQSRTITSSHLITQAELDAGTLTNTATVIASPPVGTPLNQQSSITLNAVQNPSIDIQKKALTSSYSAVGDVLNYELIVTNTGNVSLDNVTVQDPLVSINQNLGNLAPGATQTLTGSYSIKQADLDAGSVVNVAILEATDPNSNTLNGQATATVSAVSTPSISITKTANKQNFQTLGEQITYTFAVENTGNVTLSNVIVTDPKINFTSNPGISLLPGNTAVIVANYQVTQADLDAGEIVNIASVSGQDPFATQVQDSGSLRLPALQRKALELRKVANTNLFNVAGEVVTYNFQVANIGNVTLNNVVIDDPRIPFNQVVGTLAPNQAAQFSTTYTLTQADVDALRIVNVATASGTAPDNSTVTTTDSNTITIAGVGALKLEKTAVQKTYDTAGDVLDFELTVTNTGTVTIDNIRLTDGLTGIINLDLGSLAPGASTMIPTSYTVSQADIDAGQFQNVAFVQGVESTPQARTVSAQDAVIILATTQANVKLDKVDLTKTFGAVGTTLNYQLVVTNNGNVTLTNIRLTDPLTGLDQAVQNIDPGQSRTITTSYNIQQSDLDLGSVTNVATVNASTFGNLTVQDSDQVVTPAAQKPAIKVTKAADVSTYDQVGDLITYRIEVTNSGNVTLTNVLAVDPLTNTNQNLGNLAPGQKVTITEKYQITQADINAGKVANTVTVSGVDPLGNPASSTASVTVSADQKPNLELTKTATPSIFDQVGDVITYQLVVKNTGNVTLTSTIVTDPLTGFNVNLGTLAVGASKTLTEVFTISQQDIDRGFVLNTANAQALDPKSQKVSATANAKVDAVQNPGIGLKKTTTTPTYGAVGDVVEFKIEVTNTGNETLTNVTVVDPLTSLNQNIGTLIPAQSQLITTSYTVTQTDLDAGKVVNTASVSGTDPSNQTVQANTGSQATAIQSPSVSLTKTPSQSTYSQNGESITFDLLVENTGNVTLTNVVIKDPLTGLNQTVSTLAPGQSSSISTTYSVTQQDLNKGQFVNTGIVEASAPGGVSVSDSQTATITATVNAAVEITKSATPSTYSQIGDVIRYVLKVTNTGNVTVNNIRVIDPLTGLDRNLGILNPKKTLTLNESYTITQQDIDGGQVVNTATVTAASPAGGTVQDDATATVTAVQNPGINLVKTTKTPIYNQVGDVIDFTLLVTNTGNETLFKVKVVDPLTGLSQSLGTLTPGQSSTISTSYTATQADLDAGQINNSATVTGFDPSNIKVESTAQSIATANQNAAILVTKTATPIDYDQVGDVITYQIVVTNSGNLTLTNVTVSDPLTNTNQTIPALLPSQKVTVTEKYTITQADIDAGQVINTANVSGTDPNGLAVQATTSATAFAVQNPGIGLIKTTIAPGTYSTPGDVVEFELIVENTGNETLTNVTVVDPLTGLNQAIGTLTPGQSSSLTTSYSVTQSDIDLGVITNTATVSGIDPNNQTLTAGATSLANALINSGITLEKTTTATGFGQLGELVPYEIKVENTGNTTLNTIAISDPKLGLTQFANTIDPGQVITIARNYTVTQADLDAGFILNIAEAKGTDPFSTLENSIDSVRINAVQTPGISISKTPSQPEYSSLGEVIDYELIITNSGNVTLSSLTVTDPLTNLNQALSDLIPGESVTISTGYSILQGDLDAGQVVNTATVSGQDTNGGSLATSSNATVTAIQNPGIQLTKTVNPTSYTKVGDVLTYTLTVENTGNETLDNVTVTDPLTGLTQNVGTLTPGQNQTVTTGYTVSQADVDAGQVLNTGSVTGTDPNQTVLTADAQTVSNAVQTPGITLSKAVIPGTYDQVGDVLTYTIKATNSGNVTLSGITVNDPLTNLSQTFTTLAPGKTLTLNEQYTVTQSDLDNGQVVNTATATATDPNQQVQTATGSATATAVQNPGIALIKSVDKKEYSQAGEVLTYTLTVENTGNETLDNVTVTDPLTGLTQNVGTLTPGQNQTVTTGYTVSQADVDAGQVLNTGSVTGTDPNQTVLTADAQTVSNAVQTPGITLSKAVIPGTYDQVGDVLTYTIKATNSGNVTLSGITVNDPLTNLSQTFTTLAPGKTLTLNEQYTVTQSDLDNGQVVNTATATATDPNQQVQTATGSATATAVQNPGIALIKSVDKKEYSQAGEVLTYTLTVENTGNETLDNVTVTDPLTGLTQNVGTLTPGQNQTVTTGYTVSQADVDAGQVLNTGSVTGTDPNQTVLTADAQTVSNAVQTPGITLSKAVIPGTYDQVGDVLTYTIKATNSGNVTLSGITVNDPLTNLSQTFTTLTPGKTLTLNEQYTVTQSDLDNGQVVNTATATATDPNQQVQTATGSATATAVQNPGIALIKSVDKKEYSQAGEVLTYTLTVENTGNETLDNVTVTDPLTGLTQNVGTLSPGQSQTLTTTYTTLQTDVDAGQVLNTGSVTGTDPNQTVLTADAIAVSFALINPDAELVKTVDKTEFKKVGDVLTYQLTLGNTGNITLQDIILEDPVTGLRETIDELNVGELITVETAYTITQEDIDRGFFTNTAIAKGVYLGTDLIEVNGFATSRYLRTEIVANDDDFGIFPLSFTGSVGNVLANDLVNGIIPNPTEVILEIRDPGNLIGASFDNDGNLILIPGLNEPGTYELVYRLSEKDSPEIWDEAIISLELEDDRVDLAIQKSTLVTEIYEGDEFEYEVLIQNIGDISARNVLVRDELPGGVQRVSEEVVRVSDPQIVVTPSVSGSTLSWEIPILPAKAEVLIRIKVRAGNPGLITNSASVLSDGVDTDSGNNQSAVTDEIKAFRVPNVITPNSDGLNDEFEINGLNKFVENKLVIFNRLGDIVLSVENYQNDWSATGLNAGTYFYVFTAKNSVGERFVFQGWIQVIKGNN